MLTLILNFRIKGMNPRAASFAKVATVDVATGFVRRRAAESSGLENAASYGESTPTSARPRAVGQSLWRRLPKPTGVGGLNF